MLLADERSQELVPVGASSDAESVVRDEGARKLFVGANPER
jgi:hypothetical protein